VFYPILFAEAVLLQLPFLQKQSHYAHAVLPWGPYETAGQQAFLRLVERDKEAALSHDGQQVRLLAQVDGCHFQRIIRLILTDLGVLRS
jgi:hypothetical protein